MKFSYRAIHRDLGYFYIGLIISFAFSGMMMNHRDSWHPEKYTMSIQQFQVSAIDEKMISDNFVKSLMNDTLKIKDKVKRHFLKKDNLRINAENTEVEINLRSGIAEVRSFRKTPIISQLMFLHKSSSGWWIYYSDIFALSLIGIAVTGAAIYTKAKFTFRSRGWKLALAGLLFPLLFLIFFS